MAASAIDMRSMERPATLTWAVALIVAGAIVNVATLPIQPEDAPPLAVVVPITLALSAAWLISARGIWQCARWAAVVGFIVTAVNALLAAPGVVFAEEPWINIACAIALVHAVAVCWLLVTPATRAALRRPERS